MLIPASETIWRYGHFSNYKQFRKNKSGGVITLRSFSSTLRALGNLDTFFKPNDVIRNRLLKYHDGWLLCGKYQKVGARQEAGEEVKKTLHESKRQAMAAMASAGD